MGVTRLGGFGVAGPILQFSDGQIRHSWNFPFGQTMAALVFFVVLALADFFWGIPLPCFFRLRRFLSSNFFWKGCIGPGCCRCSFAWVGYRRGCPHSLGVQAAFYLSTDAGCFCRLDLDPEARQAAEDTVDWRVNMWKALLPQVPKHLLLGKGLAISPEEST